eukprot:3670071-Pyramimonas_sp.AAC.1
MLFVLLSTGSFPVPPCHGTKNKTRPKPSKTTLRSSPRASTRHWCGEGPTWAERGATAAPLRAPSGSGWRIRRAARARGVPL